MDIAKEAERLEHVREEVREVFTRAVMRAGWMLEAYGLSLMNVEEIEVDVTMHTGTIGCVVDAYVNLFPSDVKTSVQPGTPQWAHMRTQYGRVFCAAITKQGWAPIALKMGLQFDEHGRLFLSAFLLSDPIVAKTLEKTLQEMLKNEPLIPRPGAPYLMLVTNPDVE
jgi:hypothetical protein